MLGYLLTARANRLLLSSLLLLHGAATCAEPGACRLQSHRPCSGMLRAGRAHRLCFSSLGSGSLCTGVHQDEDSRPLLDRPLGRRAGSEAPDPQLALPAGLAHQAPGALCEWGQAGRGAALTGVWSSPYLKRVVNPSGKRR